MGSPPNGTIQYLVPVTSDWEGPLGENDFEGVRDEIPNAIARLSANLNPRNYDLSGMGPGEDVVEDVVGYGAVSHAPPAMEDIDETLPIDSHTSVRAMPLTIFRERLVDHWTILYYQNRIVWPSNRGRRRLQYANER